MSAALCSSAIRIRPFFQPIQSAFTKISPAKHPEPLKIAACSIKPEVSQVATSQLDLAALLPQSVDLISKRFGFNHVSIFLVDEYRRYAVVEAATGDVGQKMLAMKQKIEVGGQSVVGSATGTGEPRLALDVGEDAVHFNNPLLPETRSEIALPLIAQGQVIGALDVQSTERAAFSDSDINILQTMANQLTNAIEAARAFQKSREALEEVSKLHEYYLRDQWGAYLKEEKAISGYRLVDSGLVLGYHDDSFVQPDASRAIEEKEPVIIHAPPQPANGKNKKTSLGQGEVNGAGGGELDEFQAETVPSDSTTDTSADISKLIAPLTLKGRAVIGTVDFEIPEKDLNVVWDEDTQRIVEAVTSQAAQAIEAARLFEQTQISREEAEALYDVGRSTVRVESERALFNTVLGKLLSTLGLSQGGILFIDEDGQSGTLHALYKDGSPVDDPDFRFPITGNLSYEKLIETKRPIAIEDMATDPLVAKVRDLDLAGNIASLLLVPIVINDVVIGAVGADAVGEQHTFTEREINLAMAMADQLSIALQNRRLIEETSRRAVLLQTSADVGRVATSILDQETMIDQAVDLIRNRFGFYHAQIFLIDEAGQFAVLHKSSGESQLTALAGEHKLAVGSQSVIGQVTHQRKPIVVRNRNGDRSNTDAPSRNEFLPETQSELAIPLQVGDRLIGALDVQSTETDAFTEEEIFTLETLSAQLAIAIQNARAFKEQQETAERLKEIDKLKTQFLANMSHELRTPLNSIIGFSRVILKGIDGPLTELQKADLTSIHNSGQHLLGLINNILDLSKIEAGKMELNFADTEIEPIIKTVMSTAIALVKDKKVTLRQEIPEHLPTVWADSTRIRQVVLNLISNACKFTDEGTVTARVRTEGDSVVFSVSDTGIGIPDELIPTIFEEFTQVDASTTRKAGGTGLGLPISRHFIEMHYGKIWVDSDVGRGSTFSFYIPIKPPHRQDLDLEDDFLDSEDLDDDQKRLIIAIDDDPSVITLYRRFLEKQNYEVVGISQTENVISRVREYAPSAILLDVVLPGKDGWVILKDLKDDPFTKDVPVIMCSIISDKNRGFSLGAADYLTKPIAEEKLIGALKQLDNQDGQEIKVLVVDDQADDILLIRRILEAQSNYNIIEAENGREGLELIKDREPDLIILDLNMPEMDGFATIEALKSSERTRQIPIIIVSAQDLTRDEQRRLTGQVEALLHKGLFTENELLEDVSRALEKVGREEKIII
jgi:signal transduction histidine kinase/response regulator RpfG family c-di-GMP phosphodiesterase